mmetsp:Transcript_10495/g.20734  ORF Transcript_10495/g.20734 Transcript_10495/m.20734 type:complete len:232 (-) Transcript_10495:40-735(-)
MPSFLNCLPISYTLSIPPTTSIFRYNSGATRIYNCISKSLWYVMNGLAVAPPGIMFIIGVSTSRKPRSFKNDLTPSITLERTRNTSATLGFIIKSRYLCLYRVSWSLSPKCAPGAMCRQGANTCSDVGNTDNSPLFDFPGYPSTPTISPRFTEFISNWKPFTSRPDSSKLLASQIICTLAPSDLRSKKISFAPDAAFLIIRPAIETLASCALDPASRSLYFSTKAGNCIEA